MQVEAKDKKIDLEANIQAVIGSIEAQIQELDERRAELLASLKLHRRMLNLALEDKDASKDKTGDDKRGASSD